VKEEVDSGQGRVLVFGYFMPEQKKDQDKFAKSHENMWTTEIYNVTSRAGPNSFVVDVPAGEVPVWPLHALQVVRKALRDTWPQSAFELNC
jgi:hypothetical protein